MNDKYTQKELEEFLRESNHIESEYSEEALEDAHAAWEYLIKQEEITPEVVLEVHRLLARRLNPEIAGKYRTCDVWIAKQCKRFISVALLKEQLTEECRKVMESINAMQKADVHSKTESAKKCHISFEQLHPFLDFNGRTFRHILNYQRLHFGLPLLIIHADWPKKDGEQMRYYAWFRES